MHAGGRQSAEKAEKVCFLLIGSLLYFEPLTKDTHMNLLIIGGAG